jgi:hypothetical protein
MLRLAWRMIAVRFCSLHRFPAPQAQLATIQQQLQQEQAAVAQLRSQLITESSAVAQKQGEMQQSQGQIAALKERQESLAREVCAIGHAPNRLYMGISSASTLTQAHLCFLKTLAAEMRMQLCAMVSRRVCQSSMRVFATLRSWNSTLRRRKPRRPRCGWFRGKRRRSSSGWWTKSSPWRGRSRSSRQSGSGWCVLGESFAHRAPMFSC